MRSKGFGVWSFVVFFLISVLCHGCSYDWQKKFIRKKRQEEKGPQFEIYQKQKSYSELYTEHYNYWRSWYNQLLEDLGTNRKKEVRDWKEARRQLESLQKYLVAEKAQFVEGVVLRYDFLTKPIQPGSTRFPNYDLLKNRLKGLQKDIEKNLHFKKVEDYFLPTPLPMDMEAYEGEEPVIIPPEETKAVQEGSSGADQDQGQDADNAISYEEYRALPVSGVS